MFRLRVGAQGFTVLACVAGSIYYERQRRMERFDKKKADELLAGGQVKIAEEPKL